MKEKFNINKLDPCEECLEYYNSHPDFETAWNNCQRGDWMLWIAKKLNVNDRVLTLAKAQCANTVRHLMIDQRSIDAVDAAIKYGNDEISREELDKFANAAFAAAYYASSYYYHAASSYYYHAYLDAAFVAVTASAAAFTTFAYVIDNIVADAYSVASDARKENKQQTADICRKYLTDEIFNKIK